MNPRKPTEEEKEQLIQYLFEQENTANPTEEDREDKAGMIENAAIAVFDGYITDGPGYSGRVMVVVWSGGPDITETFVWREGKLESEPIQS